MGRAKLMFKDRAVGLWLAAAVSVFLFITDLSVHALYCGLVNFCVVERLWIFGVCPRRFGHGWFCLYYSLCFLSRLSFCCAKVFMVLLYHCVREKFGCVTGSVCFEWVSRAFFVCAFEIFLVYMFW